VSIRQTAKGNGKKLALSAAAKERTTTTKDPETTEKVKAEKALYQV
jgi:hypothetical protein